jgi:RNA-directed DNA polymerase
VSNGNLPPRNNPGPPSGPPPKTRKELYEQIARGGKDEVIYEEMVRLGFWGGEKPRPTDPPDEIRRALDLRKRLDELRQSAGRLRNLAQLEIELKKKRMLESRKKREETKQKRLGERAAKKAETQEKKKYELRYVGERVSVGLGPGPKGALAQYSARVPTGPDAPPAPAPTTRRTSDVTRLSTTNLPVANSAAELARSMGVTLGELRFLAFSREVSTITHYRRFTIPKRTGGERVISAPRARLKKLQHWVLENILAHVALHPAAHGFVPGKSTVSNAVPHLKSAIVINVDLKDFFPTVTYRRIKGLFAKLGYSEEVATVLGLLCSEPEITQTSLDGITYYVARTGRRLPQGAPTSPAITNILCRRLDARVAGYASKRGYTFTRYADDLTMSTKDKNAKVGSALAFLRRVAAAEGFAVHPEKVRVVRSGGRQEVTGVVVNEKPGVVRAELRRFRALLYQIEKDGPDGKHWGHGGDVLEAALGFASYVAMVDPAKGNPLRQRVIALQAKHKR